MQVHGDAAAVVHHPDAAVGQQRDIDRVAVAGQRFINGVIYDFVDQMVQTARTGGTDVHARPLADGFQTFEDGDVAGVVMRAVVALCHCGFCAGVFQLVVLCHSCR
jgi:hypothetical protein